MPAHRITDPPAKRIMTKRNIEFLRLNYLRGPNIWTYRPVIEAWLDIGELEYLRESSKLRDYIKIELAEFNAKLKESAAAGESSRLDSIFRLIFK